MYKGIINFSFRISKCARLESRALLNCWKCNNSNLSKSIPICDNCATVQKPPETNNCFAILDVKETFDVNLKELSNRYRQMQSILHPDKFVNKSTDERNISAEYSSLVNKAYKTLLSPLTRAAHLLCLKDIQIGEENRSSDQQFLFDLLELNEEIEECIDDSEKLLKLDKKNKETLDELYKSFNKCLNDKDYINAKETLIKMRYYDSICVRINSLLREKGCVQ